MRLERSKRGGRRRRGWRKSGSESESCVIVRGGRWREEIVSENCVSENCVSENCVIVSGGRRREGSVSESGMIVSGGRGRGGSENESCVIARGRRWREGSVRESESCAIVSARRWRGGTESENARKLIILKRYGLILSVKGTPVDKNTRRTPETCALEKKKTPMPETCGRKRGGRTKHGAIENFVAQDQVHRVQDIETSKPLVARSEGTATTRIPTNSMNMNLAIEPLLQEG